MSDPHPEGQAIAIVGLGGRFPGAADIRSFWKNLAAGIDGITRFSEEELIEAGIAPEIVRDPSYVRARGVMADDDRFDAALFGMGAREAELTDPQHRVWIECVLSALEDAGCDPRRHDGLIGVYAGAGGPDYLLRWQEAQRVSDPFAVFQLMLGNDEDFLTTRVSYKLGLRGPSVSLGTACSTSLVAVAMACQQLLDYQCDVAVAGGVSLTVPSRAGYFYRPGMILAPDGRCRAFDARAQGTVPGDGVGAVVLKRLADALTEGDDIYAVIRGAAVNNDGDAKIGYTAPSVAGQADVIAQALAYAAVDARCVSFVEAHGTGTPLGDPIEVAALTRVFQEGGATRGSCFLGSVKTNIGHLNVAAGVAGLIKAVLALRHRAIPPTLHFERPNPELKLETSPFLINRELRAWSADAPRYAGVSSFGIGGTNVHIILSEAPPQQPFPKARRSVQIFPVSAASADAVRRVSLDLATALPGLEAPLSAVAHTLQMGRSERPYRRFVVASDSETVVTRLRKGADGAVKIPEGAPPIAFLFPGQGAQHAGMALGLLQGEPHFREELDPVAEALRRQTGLSLTDAVADTELLDRTENTQPLLFAVEYALASLLVRWGLAPLALLGHSLGEYVAACLAGVFTLDEALELVTERSRLMQETAPGAMLSVPLAEPELRPRLHGALDLAAINGPAQCVVAGDPASVEKFDAALRADGIEGKLLRTTRAFHSRLMDPILDRFARRAARIRLDPPRIPFLSSATGDWITAAQATDPAYWTRQIRETVRFSEALVRLFARSALLIEVGPGETLRALSSRHSGRPPHVTVLATLGRAGPPGQEAERLLSTVAEAWCRGAAVSWSAVHQGEPRLRVHLPTYSFDRQRYWGITPALPIASRIATAATRMSGSSRLTARSGPVHSASRSRPVSVRGSLAATGAGRVSTILDPHRASTSNIVRPQARPHGPAGWLYGRVFRPAERPPAQRTTRRWLVLVKESAWAIKLAALLGPETVLVHPGVRFARSSERSYTLDPERKEDYGQLLDALAPALPDGIVHAFSLGLSGGIEGAEQVLGLGYFSAVALLQALGARGAQGIHLAIVTAGAQAARGAPMHPESATLIGLFRVIPSEYPSLSFSQIDLSPAEIGNEELLPLLVAEVRARVPAEIALRAGERLSVDYAWIGVPPVPPASMLQEGGAYLVTGGLGGIGLTLAEHLAQVYGARLLLVSRSGLPPETEWPSLLARPKDDEARRRLEKYLALRDSGTEVVVHSADVADVRQAREMVELALSRFGALDGVIHAAGAPGGGALQRRTKEHALEIMRAKIQGTLALDAALRDVPIDFFCLCSSLTAITGGFGHADYAAANAFLDAYAERANRPGERLVVSIDWDGWREVGAAVRAQQFARTQGARSAAPQIPAHPLIDGWDPEVRGGAYRTRLDATRWEIAEHRVGGRQTLVGTAYVELVCIAARGYGLLYPFTIRELVLPTPFSLDDGAPGTLFTSVRREEGELEVRIESRDPASGWRIHASARVCAMAGAAPREPIDLAQLNPAAVTSSMNEQARPPASHIEVSERWRCHRWVQRTAQGTIGRLELPAVFAREADSYILHPALFDAAAGVLFRSEGPPLVPFAYSGVNVYAPLGAAIYCRASGGSRDGACHLRLLLAGDDGRPLVSVEDYVLRTPDLRGPGEDA